MGYTVYQNTNTHRNLLQPILSSAFRYQFVLLTDMYTYQVLRISYPQKNSVWSRLYRIDLKIASTQFPNSYP